MAIRMSPTDIAEFADVCTKLSRYLANMGTPSTARVAPVLQDCADTLMHMVQRIADLEAQSAGLGALFESPP